MIAPKAKTPPRTKEINEAISGVFGMSPLGESAGYTGEISKEFEGRGDGRGLAPRRSMFADMMGLKVAVNGGRRGQRSWASLAAKRGSG